MSNENVSLMDLELSLEDTDDLFTQVGMLCDWLYEINTEGVSRVHMMMLNDFMEIEESDKYPINSYTEAPSYVNLEIAKESLISNLIDKLKKIIAIVMEAMRNFFKRLFEIVNGIRSKTTVEKKEDVKTEVVTLAILENKPEVKVEKTLFKNTINEKVASGVVTERLLTMAYRDNMDNGYKNLKEIMEGFFHKDLTDVIWEEFIKKNDSKLKNITDYIISRWNLSHPIVATNGNRSKEFVMGIVDIINYLVENLVYRLNWWLNRIDDISKEKPENVERQLKILNDTKVLEWKRINDDLRKRLIDLFKLTPFMKVDIGADLLVSAKTAFDTFKVAKVAPTSKIDFVASLEKFEWVSNIDTLEKNVETARDGIARSEKESKRILDDIKNGYLKDNRSLASKVGDHLNEMRKESKNLMFLSAIMFSFITFVEEKVESNRKRSADLHFLIVSLGVDITKELDGEK